MLFSVPSVLYLCALCVNSVSSLFAFFNKLANDRLILGVPLNAL